MKSSTFLVLAFATFFAGIAAASTASLERAVADDIQALVNDTVNEGEQTAHVIYKNGIPSVECKLSLSRRNPQQKWAFCNVSFLVRYEGSKETRSCALLYSLENDLVSTLERAKREFFTDCLESLSESL